MEFWKEVFQLYPVFVFFIWSNSSCAFFYSFPSSSAELQKNVPNNQTGHFWHEWTLSLFFTSTFGLTSCHHNKLPSNKCAEERAWSLCVRFMVGLILLTWSRLSQVQVKLISAFMARLWQHATLTLSVRIFNTGKKMYLLFLDNSTYFNKCLWNIKTVDEGNPSEHCSIVLPKTSSRFRCFY